ncbi:MAG TPA: hypothetical protein VH436_27565 [Vicinamibacterales bacterium]
MLAIKQLGLAAFAGLAITAVPMLLGIGYAIRPNERWLSLMRPLTLAAIFAAIANTFLGLANSFIGLSRVAPADPVGQRWAMLAETSVVPFVSFVFLSTAWLCVAIGMRRQTQAVRPSDDRRNR